MTRLARMLRALHGQNAYEMLNISASASDAEIKEAYRALARARHPDRTGGTDVAEMALINVAYEVLRDLRTDYDRHLAASRTGRHGTSERGRTAAEDRRADTGDADRTRGGHPAGGLWDVPSAPAEDFEETAAQARAGADSGTGPEQEPSLWDERQGHERQDPWQLWRTTAGTGPGGWTPGFRPHSGYGPGYPVHGYPQAGYGAPHRVWWGYGWPGPTMIPPVHSFLWLAIIVTLIFPPCGIVAINRSATVEPRRIQGDLAGARQAARSSLTWSLVGLLPLILLIFLGVLL